MNPIVELVNPGLIYLLALSPSMIIKAVAYRNIDST